MATLAEKGRISGDLVTSETALFQKHWNKRSRPSGTATMDADATLTTLLARLGGFDML